MKEDFATIVRMAVYSKRYESKWVLQQRQSFSPVKT